MFLRHRQSGDMVEVLDIMALSNPHCPVFSGRFHAGEELQDPANFMKTEISFPSGEELPRCWIEAQRKDH